jgi:SAM-dependent methyltransferase
MSREEPFEAVLCVDAISCIYGQDVAVKKFYQALKPGGKLIITTVNPDIYGRLQWVKNAGPPKWFRKWLSEAELRSILERHGFRILESRTILPTGDTGILRLLNSSKLKRILGKRYLRFLEAKGYGKYRIVTAQKQ